MVTTSYPRFPGDSIGTFMEPIATSLASRGHEVHVVAPWHPLVTRPAEEGGVRFHFYRYAPLESLNVFGYAESMRADVAVRGAAYVAAPLALGAGWWAARQVARRGRATVMHGHWVVPGGITAALAAPHLPLVVSLHGSDVFVAERLAPARSAARMAFRRAGAITACSADLARRAIALGADQERTQVVPYGVDPGRFQPDADSRARVRTTLRLPADVQLIATAGRLVHKKGFEYLIEAMADVSVAHLALAGEGTLDEDLRRRAARTSVADRVHFLGKMNQDDVAKLFSAADVIVTPSIRDDAGNVDGLPNVVLEALASGTPLITTEAGGIGAVVRHRVSALVVPERDPGAIAQAIQTLQRDRELAHRVGVAGRDVVSREHGWDRVAQQFEAAYRDALALKRGGR